MVALFRRLLAPPVINRVAFEIWILLACFISGTSILFTDEAPSSIQSVMPSFFLNLYGLSLAAASIVITISLLAKDRLRGLYTEYYTLYALGGLLLTYAAVVIYSVGIPGFLPAFIAASAGFSCITTSVLIRGSLKEAGLWAQKRP